METILSEANGEAREVGIVKEVRVGREDVLMLRLLHERELRLGVEMGLLKKENELAMMVLSSKYGVNMGEYSVDVETGIAIKRATLPT